MKNRNFLVLVALLAITVPGVAFAADGTKIANDIYQHDHTVSSPNVCGDTICGFSNQTDRAKLFAQFDAFNHLQPNTQTSFNYFYTIIITPTGQAVNNVILSPENQTALKNNVAIFTACGSFDHSLCQPPVATTSNPTSNYCPLAKMILLNQGSYLNRTFVEVNGTVTKDLTHLVYPDSCLSETGQNPYSPIVVVPEFGPIAILVLAIAIVSIIAISAKTSYKFRI